MMLDGRARKTAIARHGEDDSVLVIFNSFEGKVDFKLPHSSAGPHWSLLLDTDDPERATASFGFGAEFSVPGRAYLLFVAGNGY
jgi:glycogen operon protein